MLLKKAKGDAKPGCSGFMGQGEGIVVFMVLLEVKEQREVTNHLTDEIICKERSRVSGKLKEVN